MRASSPITFTDGSAWRLAASKSFGSCAGVTFTTPVPNLGSASGVGDDGDLAMHQRQRCGFAVQMLVSRVVRVNDERGVAKHGFGTRCGDGKALVAVPQPDNVCARDGLRRRFVNRSRDRRLRSGIAGTS